MRRQIWKPLLTVVTLATTLPGLAILCRGHSPSRYDVANLPTWEQATPSQPIPLGKPQCISLNPSWDLSSLPVYSALVNADENRMFVNLEVSRGLPRDRLSAGKAGIWLEEAAVLGASNGDLRSKMDRVATRLMNSQDGNGYLGAPTAVHAYTAPDIAAHSNNLRGLLAYYSLTRQPALIYSAMRAGDFLLDNYDPLPGHEEAGAEDAVVFSLARLYEASGEPRYLQFAEREETTRGCDGLGLCALYEATGKRVYLNLAEGIWRPRRGAGHRLKNAHEAIVYPGPQFSAEIFRLTGRAKYLAGLRPCRATSVWPLSVAYTRGPSGICVNTLYPATVNFGRLCMSIAFRRRHLADTVPAVPPSPTAELTLTTTAVIPPLVHVVFQAGCLPSGADSLPSIKLNGKVVSLVNNRALVAVRLGGRNTPGSKRPG